jgi:hypothetical protein
MAYRLGCQVVGCNFTATNDDKDIMLAAFGSHQKNHDTPRNDTSRAPKPDRPKIAAGGTEESWNTFVTRWGNYKRTCNLNGAVVSSELFECCSSELGDDRGDDIIRENSSLLEGGEANLLAAIKRLAVIPVAKTVRRTEVLKMKQDHGEGIRTFYARTKGKADTCQYKVRCTGCGVDVEYTNEVIKDVIVNGISDTEIQRDVLGWHELDTKVASETVTFIESKEMARDALANGTSTSAMSAYRKEKKNPSELDNKEKEKKTGKCPKCDKEYKLYKYFTNSRKYNVKPFSTCFSCKPKGKSNNDVAGTPEDAAVTTETEVEAAGMFSSIGAVSHMRKHTVQESQSVKSVVSATTNITLVKVCKQVTNQTRWSHNPPIVWER